MSTKQPVKKSMQIAEAFVWFAFVAFGGIAALQLLNLVKLTSFAQAIVGYGIGAFTVLVLGYLAYKAVENRS